MTASNEQLSFRLARAMIGQLVASGVRCLVVSPGYRNSPLLLAAHREEGLRVFTAVDERAGAFCALGIAKATGTPAAVLCTSGTAVANYFPAVMEAHHSQVPLVVITADRPVELVGTGANQCTDQTKIFGAHVRSSAEISCAEAGRSFVEHARYVTGRSVNHCLAPAPGPVHLNVRFREPFLLQTGAAPTEPEVEPTRWKFIPSASGPSLEQWEAVRELLRSSHRPLFVVGAAGYSATTLASIHEVSDKLGVPLLAEAASGMGFGGVPSPHLCLRMEEALASMVAGELPRPDLVIRFGPPVTGKGLGRLLAAEPIPQVIFDAWGEAREPHLHPSIFVEGGLEGWLAAMLRSEITYADDSLRSALREFELAHERRLDNHLAAGPLTEWKFHRELVSRLGQDFVLFLGNSMPIRDANSVLPRHIHRGHVLANRGLSGIDGLLASAVGAALATGRETHLVIGDLSFLHDLSSLSLLQAYRAQLRLTVWVMNNGGGEIFRIVPTKNAPGEADWFTTPQPYDLASLAKAFQLPVGVVRSAADWREFGRQEVAGTGVRLVEVQVDPAANLAVRRLPSP